ncbi:MAG: alkaline phosphatase family protein [Acidimicrobiales bacterium]
MPVVPDFAGPCLVNVVPALLAGVDAMVAGSSVRSRSERDDRPAPWMPAPVLDARQVVLLVLDGLGWDQLQDRTELAPVLASATGTAITSVAPSTTAAALTSLTTGLPPSVHGVLGYRVHVGGEILNVLRWQLNGADARQSVPPRSFQPYPAFPRHGGGVMSPGPGPRAGHGDVPVVSRADYGPTGFSAAHLDGTVLHGWHTPSGVVVEILDLVRRGAPFVYGYYDGVDKVAHARGLGAHYDAELRSVDRMVGDILGGLPKGAVLVVTADHGQVDVGSTVEVLGPDVMDGVELLSGEGRFRWLHARPGALEDVVEAAEASFSHIAWVRTREQVIDEGWLGGEPVPEVADRLGDVVLVPFAATAFLDPADVGEQRLCARHGSLTEAEMYVPLVAWAPAG